MHRIFLAALALVVGSLFAVDGIQRIGLTTPNKAAPMPAARKSADTGAVVIAASNGHYATEALVDGREVAFIIDTGATLVALRESDAADLGYRPREHDYNVRITTANGEGRGALITLGAIEVGDITVRDVRALVLRDEALSVNLLGMSFLSRVRWTQERGELVLEQ